MRDIELTDEQRETAERFNLSANQAVFVDEYLVDLNASRACRSAGYGSDESPSRYWSVQGSRLLTTDRVREAVSTLTQERADAAGLSIDRVLTELLALGLANMEDFTRDAGDGTRSIDLRNCDRFQLAAIQELTTDDTIVDGKVVARKTRIKLADKRGALELLGKRLKAFTERHELDVPGEVKIEVVTGVRASPGSERGQEASDAADA